ncbi:hypothetical protein D3Y57_15890 [Sphingomonas paeninsulae]|uniref:Transferrin-binding protein B C-lobe/N-lobe beta barrel domain-containing protein n=1 Tax=Sphingomonas paeninsulae TaxID=2319844 RepID=A0A494TNT2_SPHPE|nr:hypothetical protein [Sphingomonas paeninsulae]AYJ87138.1 hypothetical protein D3Y57_15890 [Sphingomonas paeninsulae]
MRIYLALLAATALTACGADGPQTIGGTAAPVGSTGGTVSGGTGGGVTGGSGSGTTTAPVGFLSLTADTSFNAVGALQSLQVTGNTSLYQGNASTVRTPSGTVDYSPRDGIFTLTLADTKAGISTNVRFQDPAHRTDFSPTATPTASAPSLDGFNYLESLGPSNSPAATAGGASVSDEYTFFYQRPGVSTNYVSLAGYVRDVINTPAAGTTTAATTNIYERGALVFGAPTIQSSIPTTGTGSYTGGFLASMVNNSRYFQWVYGTSTVAVDFSKATAGLTFAGTVDKAFLNNVEVTNTTVAAGATFNATANATIDLVHTGGFTGQFATATFKNPDGTTLPVNFSPISPGSNVAGASSVDGAFYGPNAVNVGGNFRIVGGIPGQRVDIQGAFVGAKGP